MVGPSLSHQTFSSRNSFDFQLVNSNQRMQYQRIQEWHYFQHVISYLNITIIYPFFSLTLLKILLYKILFCPQLFSTIFTINKDYLAIYRRLHFHHKYHFSQFPHLTYLLHTIFITILFCFFGFFLDVNMLSHHYCDINLHLCRHPYHLPQGYNDQKCSLSPLVEAYMRQKIYRSSRQIKIIIFNYLVHQLLKCLKRYENSNSKYPLTYLFLIVFLLVNIIKFYKYINMDNPLIKNNKTWLFNDLQDRTSHYNKILCAKSLYNSEPPKRQSLLSYVNCKQRNKLEAQRRFANRKLVKSLIQINKKDSRYVKQSYRYPQSLKNQFCLREQNNKIMGQNFSLFKKIVNVNSQIGSRKVWKYRKKQLKTYEKLLDNKRQAYLDLDQSFFNAYTKLRKKRNSSLVIKIESKLIQSQRSKQKRQKCYTQPVESCLTQVPE